MGKIGHSSEKVSSDHRVSVSQCPLKTSFTVSEDIVYSTPLGQCDFVRTFLKESESKYIRVFIGYSYTYMTYYMYTYQQLHIHDILHVYLPTATHTWHITCIPTYSYTYMTYYMYTYLQLHIHDILHVYLPTATHTWHITCIPTYSYTYMTYYMYTFQHCKTLHVRHHLRSIFCKFVY